MRSRRCPLSTLNQQPLQPEPFELFGVSVPQLRQALHQKISPWYPRRFASRVRTDVAICASSALEPTFKSSMAKQGRHHAGTFEKRCTGNHGLRQPPSQLSVLAFFQPGLLAVGQAAPIIGSTSHCIIRWRTPSSSSASASVMQMSPSVLADVFQRLDDAAVFPFRTGIFNTSCDSNTDPRFASSPQPGGPCYR